MATNPNDMASQIADIKSRSNRFTNTAVRGVQGGFVVTGQVQYQDKDTKGIVLTENAEGVAANANQACQMSLNYHNSGSFDGTQQADPAQGNMFAPAGGAAPASI